MSEAIKQNDGNNPLVQAKKKRSKDLTLLDLVKPQNVVVKKVSAGPTAKVTGFHSNAARWNESLAPKTFLVTNKKPKKKKLSIFKKKILLVSK